MEFVKGELFVREDMGHKPKKFSENLKINP